MRNANRGRNFLLCLLLNIFFNFEGMIPAVVLLVLYFLTDLSLWWAAIAAAVWIVWIVLYTFVLGLANKCGNMYDKPKDNKNPYSAINK